MTNPREPYGVRMGRVYDAILVAPRYLAGLDHGEVRPGHPEGTVRLHVAELVTNLKMLRRAGHIMTPEVFWHLLLAIHVHDTFKGESHARRPGTKAPAISDADSHASIARAFLSEYTDDPALLATVQWHDEPFAIWRKLHYQQKLNEARWNTLVANIPDWPTFVTFCIIDGISGDKRPEPVHWLLVQARDAGVIARDEYSRCFDMTNLLLVARADRQQGPQDD